MPISIPKAARTAAIQLLRFSRESQQELLSELEKVQPIYTPETFSKQLKPQLLNEGADEIVRLLFGIYPLVDAAPNPATLANDFVQSLREFEKEAVATVDEEQIENFRQFLARALALHSTLGVSAKALRLMRQHQYVYGMAEIFSDIRSVFSPDSPSLRPDAGVVVHQLKIHAHSSVNSKDFYVAMDHSDLIQLKETVERALTKHKTLVEVMKTLNLHHQQMNEEEK